MKNKMNYNKIFFFFFLPGMFFLTGFRKNKEGKMLSEEKWSGTVTFHEQKIATTFIRCHWWMIATIKDNVAAALDSSIIETRIGDRTYCATRDTTELELGIEEDKGEYGITVPMPGCYGYAIDKYGVRRDDYGLTDQTAIVINRQPLGKSRDLFIGTLVWSDTAVDGTIIITTHTWNLKKNR